MWTPEPGAMGDTLLKPRFPWCLVWIPLLHRKLNHEDHLNSERSASL